jgi:hypothetical protein
MTKGISEMTNDFYELQHTEKLIVETRDKLESDERGVSFNKGKLQRLYIYKNEIKSKPSIYLSPQDLVYIIKYILNTQSGIKEAFNNCEKKFSKDKDWAKKTIRFNVYKNYLKNAFVELIKDKNKTLVLMESYDLYDIDEIVNSTTYNNTYSAALVRMKKQLRITYQLYEKDLELKRKEQAILDKEIEINLLKAKLATDSIMDKKKRAHKLRLIDPSMSYVSIANLLGVCRQVAANYFKE